MRYSNSTFLRDSGEIPVNSALGPAGTWSFSCQQVWDMFRSRSSEMHVSLEGRVPIKLGSVFIISDRNTWLLVRETYFSQKSPKNLYTWSAGEGKLLIVPHQKPCTVSFHNFKSQNFKLSVSNPSSKYVAYVSVLSQISNCQGLGRKNKHDILKTDHRCPESRCRPVRDSLMWIIMILIHYIYIYTRTLL